MRRRHFLRLPGKQELLRLVDSGLFLFQVLENKQNHFFSGIKTVAGYLEVIHVKIIHDSFPSTETTYTVYAIGGRGSWV